MSALRDQLDLGLTRFTPPPAPRVMHPPYQPATETSRAAAKRIAPEAGALELQVLDFITARGERGATRKEVEQGCLVKGRPMLTPTACARLNRLEELGYVRKKRELVGPPGEQTLEIVRRDKCAVYVATGKRPS